MIKKTIYITILFSFISCFFISRNVLCVQKIEITHEEESSGGSIEDQLAKFKDLFEIQLTPAVKKAMEKKAPTKIVSNIKLEGIAMGAAGSYAVINGNLYKAGEEKDGVKVEKIRKKEVDVLIGGKRRTLKLLPSGKKEVDKGNTEKFDQFENALYTGKW